MTILKPKNPNYAITVVEIKTTYPLEGSDFLNGTLIFGNQVIVSKDVKVGDIGLFIPVETQLSADFCANNNLFRDSTKNIDNEKKGYIEENRRIRAVRLRGHRSEGLFTSLDSLNYIEENIKTLLKVGDEFDTLKDQEICRKYVVKKKYQNRSSANKKSTKKHEDKLVEGQFRFHENTSQFGKNVYKFNPQDLISITYKIHGTSGISSYLLCKRKLKWYDKFVSKLGVNIKETEYDYIYSSRRVIKNSELNPNAQHFYNEDVWGLAHKQLEPFLTKGMTIYYEIAGFLPDGGYIQKDYDYGCEPNKFKIYIYRITYTNEDGNVIEYSMRQVQDFCRLYHLNPVPLLFYGQAKEFSDERMTEENWQNKFLTTLQEKYNNKDCYICQNKVPEEGVVIRKESLELEAYKLKSPKFYEWETKQLDKGEVNIEDNEE